MNMNKFLFASIILAGMTACSKEDIASENNESGSEMEGAAYMSISIAMPEGSGSRANETQQGTSEEQTISNMSIYIWDRNNNLVQLADPKDDNKMKPVIYDFIGSDLRPDKPNNTAAPDKSTVYTTQPIPVSKSDVYKIAVLVNNGRNISKSDKRYLSANVTPDFLRNESTVTDIKTITGNNLFLMTNATTVSSHKLNNSALDKIETTLPLQTEWSHPDGKFLPDGTFGININGTKANPTAAIIPVERSVAKLEEGTTTLTHDIFDNKKQKVGSVTFTDVALVNANTKFYPVKELCLIPTDKQPIDTELEYSTQTDTDKKFYIVDPNFVSHNIVDFLYNKFESSKEGEKINWSPLNPNRPSFYTLENTMIAKDQMNAYTTGFYYKAKFTLDKKDAADQKSEHVYKFGPKLYSFTQLKSVDGISLGELTDDSSIEEFHNKGITKYENGVCYYPYWIRHINNPESLAPMEFGVVRNNWYKMAVTKVNEIGFNKPENPDPNTPDENPDTMLEVLVKVMPWTVRNNNIEF